MAGLNPVLRNTEDSSDPRISLFEHISDIASDRLSQTSCVSPTPSQGSLQSSRRGASPSSFQVVSPPLSQISAAGGSLASQFINNLRIQPVNVNRSVHSPQISGIASQMYEAALNTQQVNGMSQSPLTNGMSQSPLTNGMSQSPLTNGMSRSPLTNGMSQSPLTNGMSQSPLTNGTSRSPLTNGMSQSPLTNGMSQSPLTNGTSQSPLTNGTSQSPSMSQPASSSPLGLGSQIFPLMTMSATSSMMSDTDGTLSNALVRLQDLLTENKELKEILTENTELMKDQNKALEDYKVKVRNANACNKEKFEQTKKYVLNLKAEKLTLKEECDSLTKRMTDLELQLKSHVDHRSVSNTVIDRLQAENDRLQKKLTQEKEDMVLVKMEVPANEEVAKLVEKNELQAKENEELREENSRLVKDMKQFKLTTDQLLNDLENTQLLKSNCDLECKNLSQENTKLSTDIQQTLENVKNLQEKIFTLQNENKRLINQGSAEGSENSSYVEVLTTTKVTQSADEQKIDQTTTESQTTDSLANLDKTTNDTQYNSSSIIDILSQLHQERETVAELRTQLMKKDDLIQRLEGKLRNSEDILLCKTTRLNSTPDDISAKQAKVISDLKSTTDKLDPSGTQFQTHEDVNNLRYQVFTLINEVQESQTKLSSATTSLQQKNVRVEELEVQVASLSEGLERQREQDDSLIDSMRIALVNAEEAIRLEREQHEITRDTLTQLRGSYNQMINDYRDMIKTFDEYRHTKEEEAKLRGDDTALREEINELRAKVIAADDAIAFKNRQVQQLQHELDRVRGEIENIPVLKAQAEVYKLDFDAERKAREKQYEEKETIVQQMNDLQLRNQQLIDELEVLSKHQIAEMQQKHGATNQRSSLDKNKRPIPPRQTAPVTPEVQAQSNIQYPHPTLSYPDDQPLIYPHESVPDYTLLNEVNGFQHCPKCGKQCPDLDSLQFHVIECLDKDNGT